MAFKMPRKRPMLDSVKKFIADIPDLIYDGAKIQCVVCKMPLMCWSKSDCQRHINSAQHQKRAGNEPCSKTFQFDLCVTLILCNLPFVLLDNDAFVSFWNKYSNCKLPSRTSLRSVLTSAREDIEKRIKSTLKNKKLWLCVGETIDRKKHSVVNVMVRAMEPHQPSSSILLASKRVKNCTGDEILKVVLNSLNQFELSVKQLLLFISDGAANMLSLGRSLKEHSGNFLHVTCKINALNLVAQTICECYPRVNALIASTKAVFQKSPEHMQEFHRLCPQIPEPPQPIDTQWGTWLQAAFYYNKYFDNVKNVVLKLDPTEAADINRSQEILQDNQVKGDLQSIHSNYLELAEGIEKLQNVSLSLVDSLQILNNIHKQLCTVEGKKNVFVIEKLESVFDKDSDFLILRQICEGVSQDSLSCFKDYFKFANITALDVERSFSEFKNIYSAHRTCLAETTVETYLMIEVFNGCYPDSGFREDSKKLKMSAGELNDVCIEDFVQVEVNDQPQPEKYGTFT